LPNREQFRRQFFATLLLAILLISCVAQAQPLLEQASSSYKLRKDYASLEVIHRHLALGMARPAVETLLGEADYSPIEGQYYYLSDRQERLKDAGEEQGEASVGLVLDYRNKQGELTDALQTFWLGVLGE
jgi:hypothetical protein